MRQGLRRSESQKTECDRLLSGCCTHPGQDAEYRMQAAGITDFYRALCCTPHVCKGHFSALIFPTSVKYMAYKMVQ